MILKDYLEIYENKTTEYTERTEKLLCTPFFLCVLCDLCGSYTKE